MFQAGCEFCDEFAGGVANSFFARYQGSPKSRLVFSTDSFHLFPSIGQLVDGYVLLAPKEHYATFAEMPRVMWPEFERIYRYVRSEVCKVYGPCITYEHGARGGGGCGIYHAHMHLVPFPGATYLVGNLKSQFAWRILPELIDLREQDEGHSSYLFCEAPNSPRYLFSVGDLPSQFMRRLLSVALGRDDWDWRRTYREERLLGAIERLSRHFEALQGSREDEVRGDVRSQR